MGLIEMSIRKRLLLIVILAMLPPLVLIGVRFIQDYNSQTAHAADDLTRIADGVAASLDEKIQGTSQLLYGLARAPELATTDRAACSKFLSEVREEYPVYTGILTINPDGQLFCDSLDTGRNLDLRDRNYFQRAAAGVMGIILEPTFGRLTNLAVIQIAFPVRATDGTLQRVILASLNVSRLLETNLKKTLRGNTQVVIVDRHGTVLAGYPGSAAFKNRLGTDISATTLFKFADTNRAGGIAELDGLQGNRRVWAVAAKPGERDPGVFIIVGTSKDELVAPANARLMQDTLLLFALSLFLIGGAWLVAEHAIRRPVNRIAEAVGGLGEGDLATRLTGPIPRGELGQLMLAVNSAAQSLESQRADIATLNDHLRQSQKMEAVGNLTGGIAHDFNNLMTVILGNSEMLSEELETNPRLKQLADTSLTAAERAADLTRSLLAFARKQPLHPRSVDLADLFARMKGLLERSLGETVECIFVPNAGTWPALVDATQLESALLNLAINARDAMPDGGRLTIESANVTLDEDYCRANVGAAPGDYVAICVTDNGTGMTPAIIARAFDPFFTTKDVGKGSGLGLSMIYGFVKQSNGYVNIYSEIGFGTSVRLYLPRAETVGDTATAGAPEAIERGNGETILIVEDNDIVHAHVVGLISELGYRTVTARDGAEAIAILKGAGPIDLLFTDIVMPGGRSGIDLAREAAGYRPGLKVLYTSGYSENTVVQEKWLGRDSQFLGKPYRRLELAAKIHRALS